MSVLHGGSFSMLLGAWVIIGILALIIKIIISSIYPENKKMDTHKGDIGIDTTPFVDNSFDSSFDGSADGN